jgi:hypothetical protein
VETVHAVFEIGHAEGSGRKQVRLLEENAIAIPLERPDIRQKVDGRDEGASWKTDRLRSEAIKDDRSRNRQKAGAARKGFGQEERKPLEGGTGCRCERR